MQNFERLWKTLNIQNDDFIRTTQPRHEKVVQEVFRRLMASGDIYKGEYEGWYCVPARPTYPRRRWPKGRPAPTATGAHEDDGGDLLLPPLEIHRAASQILRRAPRRDNAEGRYNEVVSFIKSGLRDQSISRTTLKWGIPLPGDEKHVLYVWFDALINYISALGFPEPGEKWEKYWPAARHLVGKDIIRFPLRDMARDAHGAPDSRQPVRVFAHGWWTVEGEKMSKSLGNVVDPFEMEKLYGVDTFRYFLLREVPFGHDGDFSELALVQRINSDLANDLGNLLSRSLQMIDNTARECSPPSADRRSLKKRSKPSAKRPPRTWTRCSTASPSTTRSRRSGALSAAPTNTSTRPSRGSLDAKATSSASTRCSARSGKRCVSPRYSSRPSCPKQPRVYGASSASKASPPKARVPRGNGARAAKA